MAKLTRSVLIRFSEEGYQQLKMDAMGFKSLSYYVRNLIRERKPLCYYTKDRSMSEISKSTGIERRKVYVTTKGNIRKKLGRNDSCYCGSGKKFKKCCMRKENVV